MNLQLASDFPPFPMRRSYHRVNLESLDYQDLEGRFEEAPEAEANTVSSMVAGTQWHAPCLDIDFPCTLLPSSTPGHHHLFIDKLLTWDDYLKILLVLAEVGIIERGYLHASMHRQATHVRKPGVRKGFETISGIQEVPSLSPPDCVSAYPF